MREVLAADVVTVRERGARQVLEEVGVHREIMVTADPALLLKPEPLPRGALKREGLEAAGRLIGMSVREPGVAAPDINEEATTRCSPTPPTSWSTATTPTWCSCRWSARCSTSQHSHAVIAQMLRAQRATVLKGVYTSGQLLSLMSSSTSWSACGCTS